MPTAANPLRFASDWDVIRIGGVVSPGVCRIGKTSRHHQWDVKRGKGALGSTITYQGIEPAKFTVDFDLWRDPAVYQQGWNTDVNDFDLWDAYVPLFRYDPTKKTIQAVEIYHPSLAQIGIHSVVVEDVGNLVKKSEGSWVWTVQVAFMEYLPPPSTSAVSNPAGSKTNASTNPKTQPTPPLDANALLQQLQAQAQSPDG